MLTYAYHFFLQFRCILCYIQTSWNWKRGCTYLKSHNTLKFEPGSLKCILSVPKISYDTNLIIVTCYLAIKIPHKLILLRYLLKFDTYHNVPTLIWPAFISISRYVKWKSSTSRQDLSKVQSKILVFQKINQFIKSDDMVVQKNFLQPNLLWMHVPKKYRS